jgi:C4-dicarboxylate-specific signal transduction histidine kinase
VLELHSIFHRAVAEFASRLLTTKPATPLKTGGKLFTPFFATKNAVGTGPRLWLTKDLLEKKGGRIQYRSADRLGTEMRIYSPPQ